jgi:hypothetical protein
MARRREPHRIEPLRLALVMRRIREEELGEMHVRR